jgi:hypothetical protein
MNLNIKKLADQAGIDTEDFENAPVELYGAEQQLTQFAQLIVKECANKVDNILRERKDGGGTMGDEIREHFGVTE